jgi:hypothetical protein
MRPEGPLPLVCSRRFITRTVSPTRYCEKSRMMSTRWATERKMLSASRGRGRMLPSPVMTTNGRPLERKIW